MMEPAEGEAPQFAFVDEYGDPRLPTDETKEANISTHFIVTAVIVDAQTVDSARENAERIRLRHFQKGEMKSNLVGDNDERRIRILTDISKLNIHFYSLAVDKRELYKDSGLSHKKSFIKFINRIAYKTLYRRFFNLAVIADQHGRKEFMDGFVRYVEDRCIPDLFRRSTFIFKSSETDPLLQVADFLSGTLSRIFDPKKLSARADEFLKLLQPQTLLIEEWPPRAFPAGPHIWDKKGSSHDHSIRHYCITQARLFLENHVETVDESVQYQVEALKYLLYYFRFEDARGYVGTRRILDAIVRAGLPPVDVYFFRSNVVARLRDAGVILASSSQGYKLPYGVSDIRDFVEHGERIVVPMLNRIQTAREHILMLTKKEVDILDGEKYEKIRELLENANRIRKTK